MTIVNRETIWSLSETIEGFTCRFCGHPEAGLGPGPLLPFKALHPNRVGYLLRMRECTSCHKLLWREDHYWEVLKDGKVVEYACCACKRRAKINRGGICIRKMRQRNG